MLSSYILWSFLLSITLTSATIAPNTWVNETALTDIWGSNDPPQASGAVISSSASSSSISSGGNSISSTISQSASLTKHLTTAIPTSSALSLDAETTSSSISATVPNLASGGLLSNLTLLPSSGGEETSSYPSGVLLYISTFVAMSMIFPF